LLSQGLLMSQGLLILMDLLLLSQDTCLLLSLKLRFPLNQGGLSRFCLLLGLLMCQGGNLIRNLNLSQ
jgi:hypothetical protein